MYKEDLALNNLQNQTKSYVYKGDLAYQPLYVI